MEKALSRPSWSQRVAGSQPQCRQSWRQRMGQPTRLGFCCVSPSGGDHRVWELPGLWRKNSEVEWPVEVAEGSPSRRGSCGRCRAGGSCSRGQGRIDPRVLPKAWLRRLDISTLFGVSCLSMPPCPGACCSFCLKRPLSHLCLANSYSSLKIQLKTAFSEGQEGKEVPGAGPGSLDPHPPICSAAVPPGL